MNSRPYTVHIYESEATLLSKWTLQYPNIETGGDLFGLWLNANEVVIQAAIGPGQNCRRTRTSFLQDEQYLNSVGELLICYQGLCRVGSWLSHASDTPEPSPDDNENVWRQLPTPGRFLLLTAVIKTETETPKVEMGFNLFESTVERNKITPMKLDILQGKSPIRANKGINSKILEGAELHSNKNPYPEPAVPEQDGQSSFARPEVNKRVRAEGPEISRPDMKFNRKNDDGSEFFEGERQQPGRQGDRRPQNQDRTCDGAPLSPVSDNVTEKYDDNRDFFKGERHEAGRQGHRRPLNQDYRRPLNQGGTCDGAPSYPVSYNTFQHSYYREFRHRRPNHHTRYKQHPYSYRVHDLPDGRQLITLYHNDHELGRCGDCCNTSATLTKNGKLRVEHQSRTVRCTII